ncbi:MAG: MBL fold metallo-hydrolase [Candidatus Pacearchaeota archaeon]
MKIRDVELKWLGHAGFQIKYDKILYIDPYNIRDGFEKADFILITHSHYDHCSYADIGKVVKENTKIIIPVDSQSKITKFKVPIQIEIVEPNKEIDFGNLRVYTLPAYNVNKNFHPKDDLWLGYVIKIGEVIIYHAGDTDVIPEMQKLTGYRQSNKEFVALLPVGGRFTMNAEEAYEAAKIIKPTLAIPMHWGTIIGSLDDATEFCDLCKRGGIRAEILEKE